MSIASFKSTLQDLIRNSGSNENSIGKKLETISSNLKNSTPTIIAKDLKIEGHISGSGIVEIEGVIKGTINGNIVILREDGSIEGEVMAESLNIRGNFHGTVRAKNVNISSKAKVIGLIEYDSLSVEDGAFIDGQFKQNNKIASV